MCRIALWPVGTAIEFGEERLKAFLKQLQCSLGGHGNGIGWWEGTEPHVVKGVKMTTDECAQTILDVNRKYRVLFHTRLASRGSISEENCHPFLYGNWITCHNGTWGGARAHEAGLRIAGHLRESEDNTDSETIAAIVGV